MDRATVQGALEEGYTQTNRITPIYYGVNSIVSFTGTPTPVTGATVTIKAFGDFSGTDEYLNVSIAGVNWLVFVTGGSDTQEVTAVIQLTLAEVMAARSGTTIVVNVSASSGVNFVSNSYVDLTLTYHQDPGVADLYRVALAAGERLDLAAATTVDASLSIADAAGVSLRMAQGVSPFLRGFIAPAAGDYYVRISGPTSPYTLTATRNAELAVETKEPADLTSTGKALGDLGSPDAMDSYTVMATAGDELVIETDVPLVGPGSRMYFVDPMLELVDPSGQVVATDLNGTGDGRNARITHTAAMTGRYTVRVSHENDGAVPGLDARFYAIPPVSMLPATDALTPALVRVDPNINYPTPEFPFANSGLLFPFLATNWSGVIAIEAAGTYAFTLGSKAGSRLTIDGTVVVNNDGLHNYLERVGAIQLEPGLHDIRVEMFDVSTGSIAVLFWQQPTQPLREVVPASVLLHGDPAGGVSVAGAYSLSVTGATAPPAFQVLSVTPANLTTSLSQVTVRFTDPVTPASIQPGDLTIDGNPAASVTLSDDTAVFTLAAPAAPGAHAIAIAGGAVSDFGGNLVEPFASSITVDAVAPRVIATSVAPGGTVISDAAGSLSVEITFDEPINFAAVNPSDVAVTGSSVGSSTRTVTYDESSRTMTVSLTGFPDASMTITLQSTFGGVRDMAGNLLDGDGNGAAGGSYVLSFLVDAPDAITVRGSEANGAINYATTRLSIGGGISSADTDTFLVTLDAGQVAWFAVDGGASTTATVQMFSPGGALIASATAAALGGIAELPVQTITEAGEYRFVVTGAVTGTGDSYTFYKVFNGMNDLDSLNTRTSVARNIDALFVPLDGDASFAWVQRQVNLLSTRNYVYSMTLSAGDALSVLYDPGSSSSTSRVTDPTGTTLAQDATTGSLANRQIRRYTAPADGVYLVRFDQTSSFDALFGVNLDLRTEAATSDAGALSINDVGKVLGAITGSTQVDRHRFTLTAGQIIEITTRTPFDDPGEPAYTLNPRLELVDPVGNVVATDLSSAADGRNARIVATALMNGDYLIRIAAESGTGAYLLAAEVTGTSVAPTDIMLSNQAIAENQPAGAIVGVFTAIDADAGEAFTYSLVSGEGDADNALFTIVGDELVAAASFDFEASVSHTIRVRATDRAGLFVELPLIINVTDVNEDSTPPVVERVSVSGGWHTDFYAHLAASGVGGTWGYALPEGANQLRPLTWTGITRVAIHFSENVDVVASDLTVLGVNVPDYASRMSPGGFSYDSNTFIAAWTFTAPLTADKLRLLLDDRVADVAGNALDGEWTDAVSTASGDGAAGGDFSYRMNVLPGDATPSGRVQSGDLIVVRNAQFTRPGVAGYSAMLDVDGTANISSADVIKTRNLQFTRLPDAEPPASPPMQGGQQQVLAANAAFEPALSVIESTTPAQTPVDALSESANGTPAESTQEPALQPQSLSMTSVQLSQLAAPLAAAATPAPPTARSAMSRKPWERVSGNPTVFDRQGGAFGSVERLLSDSSIVSPVPILQLPGIMSFRVHRR